MTGVKPSRHSKKHNVFQGLFFVTLVSLAVYVLLQSAVFEVRNIEIIGRNEVPQEELLKLSGVVLGSNIFKVDLSSGEEKIRMLPLISDVQITRKFPATVVIDVTERVPVALLPLEKGFTLIDIEGVYLRQGSISEDHYPVITGFDFGKSRITPGQAVTDDIVITALQVIQQLPSELIIQLSEIHIDDRNRVLLYTINGDQGRFGLPEDISQKADVFLQVLGQQHHNQRIEYVDLSSFRSPVVKYVL